MHGRDLQPKENCQSAFPFFDSDIITLTHRLGSESPCALSYPSANRSKDVSVKTGSAHWLFLPSLFSACFLSERIGGKFIQGPTILQAAGTCMGEQDSACFSTCHWVGCWWECGSLLSSDLD